MNPLMFISAAGLMFTVGDVVFRFWLNKPTFFSSLYITGLACWIVGLLFLAESIKFQNIAVASAAVVVVNVATLALVSRFYFGDSFSTIQIVGLALACIAIFSNLRLNNMAMFREHISLGALVSVVGIVFVFFYGLLTDPVLLGVLFLLGVLGSFLPDVDSDSGMPFYLMFGTVTLAFGGLALYFQLSREVTNYYVLAGIPLVALILFWFIVGGMFKHITHHRGIWHSLPAMGIAALCTYFISLGTGVSQNVAVIFSAMVGAGFLSHLVLDEICSGLNLEGIWFIPKQSLGSALKLFSHSKKVNLFTYVLLGSLLYIAFKSGI